MRRFICVFSYINIRLSYFAQHLCRLLTWAITVALSAVASETLSEADMYFFEKVLGCVIFLFKILTANPSILVELKFAFHVHCALCASFAALVNQQPSSKGCFFYESDWLTWLRLWVLSQTETIITIVVTLEKLWAFTKWQFHKIKMSIVCSF